MRTRGRIAQGAIVVGAVLLCAIVFGVLGLGMGVEYGGHLCETCAFRGTTGYEATGQVGFLIGAAVGLLGGAWGAWRVVGRR